MLIPVRCYTCGKVIGNKWERYKKMEKKEIPKKEIFNDLKITRYCCKRMLIAHVDTIDDVLKYDIDNFTD